MHPFAPNWNSCRLNARKKEPDLQDEAAGAGGSHGGCKETNRSTVRLIADHLWKVFDAFKVQNSSFATSAYPAHHLQITCAEW